MASTFGVTVQALLSGGGRPQLRVEYRSGTDSEVTPYTEPEADGGDSADFTTFMHDGDPMMKNDKQTEQERQRAAQQEPDPSLLRRKIVDWQGVSTGISFFDGPQKDFILMVNRLYAANLTGGWSQARDIFEQILRHALSYFQIDMKSEEAIMKRVSYPDYAAHKADHVLFLKEIHKQAERYKADEPIDVKSFVMFLREWVLSHIGIKDRAFALYLTKLKREGSLAKIIMQVRRTADNRIIVREQGTENSEQGTENSEQGTENSEQRAGNNE
jgi:hemerythrin